MAERTLEKPAKKWARNYETIYILRPNVDSDDVGKVATRVRDVLDRTGAKLTKVDVWGKRRLAYNIGNFTRGIFVYVGYSAHGDVIAELERNLRLLDPVMRYQTIVVEERIDLDEVEIDAAEVEWADIELGDDDDHEPTTAERLGMEERREAKSDDSDDKKAEAKSDDSDDEKAEAKSDDDSDDEKAEAKSDDDSDDEKAEAKSDDDSDDEKAEAKSDDDSDEKKSGASAKSEEEE